MAKPILNSVEKSMYDAIKTTKDSLEVVNPHVSNEDAQKLIVSMVLTMQKTMDLVNTVRDVR